MGYVVGNPKEGLFCAKMTKALTSHGTKTKKVQESCVQELKTSGRNALHSCCNIYMHGWPFQRSIRRLMVVCKPVERWYHAQHLNNRAADKTVQFYIANASTSSLQVVLDTLNVLQCEDNLRFLGLPVRAADVPIVMDVSAKRGIVLDESTFLAEVAKLQFCVAGHRMRSVLWHVEGLPGPSLQNKVYRLSVQAISQRVL